MARRKSRKPRRKTQKKLNLLGVAESVLIANVVTEGLFNCNAIQFVTGRGGNLKSSGYFPSNTDSIITLPELLGMDYNRNQNMSGGGYVPGSFTSVGAMEVIKSNARTNLIPMVGGLVGIPIAFRVGSKLTSKPRATANKMLTYTGLGVKV